MCYKNSLDCGTRLRDINTSFLLRNLPRKIKVELMNFDVTLALI